MFLTKVLKLIIALITSVYTFYAVGHFMFFLSSPRKISKGYSWVFNLLDTRSRLETAYGPIVYDTIYVITFIFQHSFMKSQFVKNVFERLNLGVLGRSIYNLTSSLCVERLISGWLPAPSIALWQVDLESSKVLWWTYVLVHTFAWTVIYGGTIVMDMPELLGIKQTYYDAQGLDTPKKYKSYQLNYLYEHVRHPSFVGFVTILWFTNIMTADRLILAVMLTLYMYLAWSTDKYDVAYQNRQLKLKLNQVKSR